MTSTLYVGIDVAKDSFDAASEPAGLKLSLPNNHKGRQELLDAPKNRRIMLITLEATGGYEQALCNRLPSRPTYPAQPNLVDTHSAASIFCSRSQFSYWELEERNRQWPSGMHKSTVNGLVRLPKRI